MRTVRWLTRFLLPTAIVMMTATLASAQTAVPLLINYQGELRSPTTGEALPDGTYDVFFRIYESESGGTPLWGGTHSSGTGNPLQVTSGIFSVILGSGPGNALAAGVFSEPDRWLEIEVGTETLSPRQRLTSVAFSMVSQTTEDANTVDGIEGADLEESAEIDGDIAAHTVVAHAHHPRYTDAEAVVAMGANAQTNPLHHDRYTDAEAIAAMGVKTDENPLNHDRTSSVPWGSITDVPAGFADGEDNDTTYTPGAGLSLLDTQFNVTFDGSGSADAVARSDHHHEGAYAPEVHGHDAGAVTSGVLHPDRYSAYEDLATEGHLDGDVGTDLLTIGGGNTTYWALEGNGGTNPVNHFLGTTDNQPMEMRVNNARAVRLEPGSSPNIIGGYTTNRTTNGVVGAAIGGGGESGFANRVADDFGTVGGGRNNQAGDDAGTTSDRAWATVGGGTGNLASGMCATVGGGMGNQADAAYATIAGGGRSEPATPATANRVTDEYGTVGGGGNNQAGNAAGNLTDATYSTVGGGGTNTASGVNSTVGGGYGNIASGSNATIAGGSQSSASQFAATVGGGALNEASGARSTVGGGGSNEASGAGATVGGGDSNKATNENATVGGGYNNQATAGYATISGGGPYDPGDPATANRVTDGYGTVAGGGNNLAGNNAGTLQDANFATVGGGHTNVAGAFSATVAGGAVNEAVASWAAIGGGNWNKVTDENGTVAGGNNNQAGDNAGTFQDANFATVGGGQANTAGAAWATISGGEGNSVEGFGSWATIGAGRNNIARGSGSTIGGGEDNITEVGGMWAVIGGGVQNDASGTGSTVPGGGWNLAAGWHSFAAGFRAKANHKGAFVWGDSQVADFASTKDDEVSFRCKGGVRFTSGAGGSDQTVSWTPGNSSWTFSSDRNLKEDFDAVDAREILEKVSQLPMAEWNFKGYSERHIGPTAQDFHALFPLGGSETMIDSGDLQGVSLAAIQGLHEIVKEKNAKISSLEARIEALETLVGKLVESQARGEE